MLVHEAWHDGDGDGARTLVEDLANVLVLETDHVLAVYLGQVVVDEDAITEWGREEKRDGGREGREGGGMEGGGMEGGKGGGRDGGGREGGGREGGRRGEGDTKEDERGQGD